MYTFIEEGTDNANQGYQLITNEIVTLGVTDLVFTRFTGAQSLTADHGLQQTGNQIDVKIADFIDTAQGLKSDGAGGGLASKIQVDLTTAQWTGEDNSGGNNKFSIAATNVDSALDTIVDKIDQELADFESQTATQGSSKVGYDGQSTTNTLFTLAASQVDAALDSLTDGLDAEMKSNDDHIATLLSQTDAKGAALVGYDGKATTNALFQLAASQVDVSLDSIADALDAEMKNQDDYEALILSQTATQGSALVGYDGITTANSLFNLAASQVDAAIDSLATGLDAEMKSVDDNNTLLASTTEGEGSNLVGYEGYTGSNTLASVVALALDSTLDSIIQQLDDEMKNQDDYEVLLLSQTAAQGSSKVGYDGITTANSLFNLAASQVDAALDSLATGLDAEMKNQDTYETLLASTTADEGSNNIGFEGYAGTNTEFSVGAQALDTVLDTIIQAIDDDRSSAGGTSGAGELGYEGEAGNNGLFSIAGPTNVGAALDLLVDGLDAEMKNQDDYETLLASQTAAQGSSNVGYDGITTANSLFNLAASQVDAALDSLATGLDAEMKNQDTYEASLLSQTATQGSALVGYDGITTANSLFNLAASKVDAAIDSLATGLDAEMKNQDTYEASLLSQTATQGSALVGYDGSGVGANGQFSLVASQVDAALDSLSTGMDTEMQVRSDADDAIVSNFNALSAVGTSAAAYTHTVNHALGTQDVIPMVWVN